MSHHPELTLAQLVEAVWRRRATAAFVFLLVLVCGAGLWIVLPREYASEGRLFVQIGRANTGLDPTNSPKSVSIQDARETEIRSVIEIINSPGLLQSVVDQIGAEEILRGPWDKYWPDWDISGWILRTSAGTDNDESPEVLAQLKRREMAVKQLGRRLTVNLEKNSSVISIYVKANGSGLAQRIVEAIMAETQRRHLAIHSVQSSGDVFQVELRRHQELVQQALTEQTEFRNSRGLLSQEAGRNTLQQQVDKVELETLDVEISLAQARRRASELQTRLSGLDEFVDAPNRGLESISTEGARGELFRLESERARLSALYMDTHPLVVQVNEQIETLTAELEKLPVQRTEMLAVVNPVFAEVKVALIDQESIIAGLESRRENLIAKRQEVRQRLEAMNEDDIVADRLAQQVDISRRHLDIYIQKAGEAQVLSELDRQSVSDVVVAQPAMRMYKPVSPKGSVLLPLTAALGLVLGTIAAWWRDWRLTLHQRTRVEIEQSLQVPVLAALPRVASRRQVVQ